MSKVDDWEEQRNQEFAAITEPFYDHNTPDQNILREADGLVYGDRSGDYGDPVRNHERIAAMWTEYLGVDITARQVAICMVFVKLSRESNKPKRDSMVDAAAYLHIADLCGEG